MKIRLASASPRRKNILESIGFEVEVKPSPYDEGQCGLTVPEERVKFLAEAKLKASLEHYRDYQRSIESGYSSPLPVLASDTLLDFQGKVLEKPINRAEAQSMLEALSGQKHRVLTSVAVYLPEQDNVIQKLDGAEVCFQPLNQQWISWYLDQNEWQDAAGAYKMQEKGSWLVKSIKGHPSTVVGLSIPLIYGIFGSIPELGNLRHSRETE
jgi:septum formation protein